MTTKELVDQHITILELKSACRECESGEEHRIIYTALLSGLMKDDTCEGAANGMGMPRFDPTNFIDWDDPDNMKSMGKGDSAISQFDVVMNSQIDQMVGAIFDDDGVFELFGTYFFMAFQRMDVAELIEIIEGRIEDEELK